MKKTISQTTNRSINQKSDQTIIKQTEITTVAGLQKVLSSFESGTKVFGPLGCKLRVFEMFCKETGKKSLIIE